MGSHPIQFSKIYVTRCCTPILPDVGIPVDETDAKERNGGPEKAYAVRVREDQPSHRSQERATGFHDPFYEEQRQFRKYLPGRNSSDIQLHYHRWFRDVSNCFDWHIQPFV